MICCEILDNLNLTNYTNVELDGRGFRLTCSLLSIFIIFLSFWVEIVLLIDPKEPLKNVLENLNDIEGIDGENLGLVLYILSCSLSHILLFIIFMCVYSNYYSKLTLFVMYILWFIFLVITLVVSFVLYFFMSRYISDPDEYKKYVFVFLCFVILSFPLMMYLIADSNRIITWNLRGSVWGFTIETLTLNNCPNGIYYFVIRDNQIVRVPEMPNEGKVIQLTVSDNSISNCKLIEDNKEVKALSYNCDDSTKMFYGFDANGKAIDKLLTSEDDKLLTNDN